jgi:FkbM family methyltransferase
MKALIKRLLAFTPYRVVRRAENRFDAIAYSLTLLRDLGFQPQVIIDAGAHAGTFTALTSRTFPDAVSHMIEPQPACQAALKRIAGTRHAVHAVALGTREDVAKGLRMALGDAPTTGAHVSETGTPVPVAALSDLVSLKPEDRALLKLDLQGFELHALQGAADLLERIEVILIEVSFFRQAFEPPILDLMAWLDAHGFELFDIAALGGRTRDNRLKQGDFIFVSKHSALAADTRWA